MKKSVVLAVLLSAVSYAAEVTVKWSGQADKVSAPKVEKLTDEDWVSYRCTPTAQAPWQSMTGTFDAPADLSKYRGVSFDFKQKAYPGDATCVFRINTGGGALYVNFPGGNGKNWKHVEIPFEAEKWKGKIDFTGKAASITIYPYQFLDKPEKYIEIANFEFMEKK